MTLTQHDIDQEIAAEHAAYEKRIADGAPVEHHPRRGYAPYRSSALRHPKQPPITIDVSKDPELVELHSPPSASATSPRSTTTSPGSTPVSRSASASPSRAASSTATGARSAAS